MTDMSASEGKPGPYWENNNGTKNGYSTDKAFEGKRNTSEEISGKRIKVFRSPIAIPQKTNKDRLDMDD